MPRYVFRQTILILVIINLILMSLSWADEPINEPIIDSPPQYCWDVLDKGIGTQNTRLASVEPYIAVDKVGNPWLVWDETDIQLRQWTGKAWEKLPKPATEARHPRIASSPSGEMVLVWSATKNSQSNIYVGRWDGKAWEQMGSPLSAYPEPTTNANIKSLVLDDKGYPIVAWQEAKGIGPRSLHVALWNGKEWSSLGEAVVKNSEFYSLEASLSIDNKGAIWLAWIGGNKERSYISVARWNGSLWQDVGNSKSGLLHSKGDIFNLQITSIANNETFLVWIEGFMDKRFLMFSRWTNNKWEKPQLVPTMNQPWFLSVVQLDSGFPLLAWDDEDASEIYNIHASFFTNNKWQSVFSGMHLDSGPSHANRVQISRASDDSFYMTWDEPDENEQRIRVIHAYDCAIGQKPPVITLKRSRSSYWTKTVDATVDDILSKMDDKSKSHVRSTARKDLIKFHMGWGTGIRNTYGLWAGNTALLESCGSKKIHPDECSMIIIERVWEILQSTPESKNE